MSHVHYWTPNFGGTHEYCSCGVEREVGGKERIVYQVVARTTSNVTAPCEGCGKLIYPGTDRVKLWHPGLLGRHGTKNGPGVWMHAYCAAKAVPS